MITIRAKTKEMHVEGEIKKGNMNNVFLEK